MAEPTIVTTDPGEQVNAPGMLTTERAAAVICFACIGFLALVRKGFGGVLHP